MASMYSICLSVPYPTKWGQNLRVVCNDQAVAQGSPLECQHVGSSLVWSAQLEWSVATHYRYRYVVVNESGTVEDQETRSRTVQLPEGLTSGALLYFTDEWQVRVVALAAPRVNSRHVLCVRGSCRFVGTRACGFIRAHFRQPSTILACEMSYV